MRKGELLRTIAVHLLSKQPFFEGFCCGVFPGGRLHDEQLMATTTAARASGHEFSPPSARSWSYNSCKTRDYGHGFSSEKAFYCTTTHRENADAPLKVVEFLNSLTNFEIEGVPKGAGTESSEGFDLGRMSRLLQRLGDPLSKYPVIHVAGTKGKGSTVAFLSSILRAAGFNVGSYTSPHIRSLRERIVSGVRGEFISASAFDNLFEKVEKKLIQAVKTEVGNLTHFELLTALAFVYFAEENVDVAVVEAGLGGSRDATNVIQASGLLAAVIVGIGEDHLEALGGSLENIARAKAGIIKSGRPVILGKQTESLAEHLIRQVASSNNAVVLPPLGCNAIYNVKGICANESSPHQLCDIKIHMSTDDSGSATAAKVWTIKDLEIPVLGAHQLDNVATAVQTALCLRREGWKISDSAIRLGVGSTRIPGRFEILAAADADRLGSKGSKVILDGAHTVASAAALARTLREVFPDHCVALVVAMASDKDHKGFAQTVLEGTKPTIIVATTTNIAGSSKRSLPTYAVLKSFICAGQDLSMKVNSDADQKSRWTTAALHEKPINAVEASSVELAILAAAQILEEVCKETPGVICVTGSLHAVAETFSVLSEYRKCKQPF